MKSWTTLFLCFMTLSACQKKYNDYNQNLANYKHLIIDINDFFDYQNINELTIDNYYTEDFIFHSYPVGHKKGIPTSKQDYIEGLNQMKKMNILLNIGHSIYLPGIDEKSHQVDGSVRVYYGATLSIDTNKIEFSGYQTINFTKGKISEIWEWADYGGVKTQLNNFLN